MGQRGGARSAGGQTLQGSQYGNFLGDPRVDFSHGTRRRRGWSSAKARRKRAQFRAKQAHFDVQIRAKVLLGKLTPTQASARRARRACRLARMRAARPESRRERRQRRLQTSRNLDPIQVAKSQNVRKRAQERRYRLEQQQQQQQERPDERRGALPEDLSPTPVSLLPQRVRVLLARSEAAAGERSGRPLAHPTARHLERSVSQSYETRKGALDGLRGVEAAIQQHRQGALDTKGYLTFADLADPVAYGETIQAPPAFLDAAGRLRMDTVIRHRRQRLQRFMPPSAPNRSYQLPIMSAPARDDTTGPEPTASAGGKPTEAGTSVHSAAPPAPDPALPPLHPATFDHHKLFPSGIRGQSDSGNTIDTMRARAGQQVLAAYQTWRLAAARERRRRLTSAAASDGHSGRLARRTSQDSGRSTLPPLDQFDFHPDFAHLKDIL